MTPRHRLQAYRFIPTLCKRSISSDRQYGPFGIFPSQNVTQRRPTIKADKDAPEPFLKRKNDSLFANWKDASKDYFVAFFVATR